jgi:hypothetical protein
VTDVRVKFVAEDQATEVARKLLETMRGLEREQRAAAAETAKLAGPTRQAAEGFERMRRSIQGLRATGGVDAITKRVQLLSEGLRSASTRAQSLARLQAAESQLQRALKQTNLSLEERIRLERTLRTTQSAITGAVGPQAAGLSTALAGFSRLQGALGAIGVTLSAISFTTFIKDAIDAADAMGELAQRTGVSTENLTVLSAAAEKSGASTDTLATGLRNLSRQVVALRQGNREAVESFRAIGLTADDLAGKRLDEIFVLIADAQAKFADGAGKTAVATRIFGRAGDELIPTLNELANGGFIRSREELAKLGALIGGDAAKKAGAFNDDLKDLSLAARGLGLEIGTTLIPFLTTVVERFIAMLRAIREFREAVPQAGRDLSTFSGGAVGAFTGLSALLGDGGKVPLAAETTGGKILELTRRLLGLKNAATAAQGAFKPFGPTPEQLATGRKPKPDVQIGDPAAAKAARQAELTAASQHARDLLAVTQAGLAQLAAANEARFAEGLSSLRDYYAARAESAQRGIAAELKTLEAEKARLTASPLAEDTQAARIQRTAEIRSLEQQIARVKIDGATQLATLDSQRRLASKAALVELGQLQAQLFRAQGEDLKAAQIEIAQAADRFAETLTRQGFGEAVVADLRSAFSTLFTDKAAFDAQQQRAEREFQALTRERIAIEQQVATGVLSQLDGQAAVTEAERRRLPALREAAALMRAFAERVGDPAMLEAAAQLEGNLTRVGVAVQQSTLLIANFRDNLLSAAQSEFANFLGSTINQVNSLGEAMRQLGLSVASAFQRVAAEIIAAKVFEKIGSLFGVGGADAGVAALTKAGVALGASAAAAATAGTAITTGAGALAGSATGLATSGGILLSAAAALTAAAAALAAAGTVNTIQAGLSSVPGVIGAASGGLIRGPGTGTSDSILARLSAGEFVIRAAVVDRLGVPFLQALNAMQTPRIRSLDSVGIPRFAEGGLVVQQAATAATQTREDTMHAVLELSPDLVLREITSSRGLKVLARAMGKHSSRFRAALG